MCEDIDIKDKDDFLEFVAEKNVKTVLLGNGFSLSNPEFGSCFTFKLNRIRQKLKKITKKKLATIVSSNDNKFDPQCPETSLEGFRKAIIEITVNEYMQKFLEKCRANDKDHKLQFLYQDYNFKKTHCTNFLNNFDAIFTTNYDPLIYFEILLHRKFADGFNGPTPITIDDTFKNGYGYSYYKKRIYYLHGSWFIRYHNKGEHKKKLSKLSFAADSQHKISDTFNWEEGIVAYLIFEDRPWCKEYFTQPENGDPYLKHCYEALGDEIHNPILVLGMSFNKDDHIVKALKGKKCYITYRGDDCKAIKEKFEGQDVTFVKLLNENVIWEKIP